MPWIVSHLFLFFNRLSVKPYSTEAGNVKGVGFDLPRLVLPLVRRGGCRSFAI
jgi:hypothetical protein